MTPLGLLAPSRAPLREIEDEVRGGLKAERRRRLDDAARSLAFYRGDFRRYLQQKGDAPGDYEGTAFPRSSLFAQRVVNVLTKDLYKEGPKRTLADHPEASQWLEEVYRANCVDAVMQEADRLSMVTDLAAVQVVPSADPRRPIRLMLWDASQLCVWEDPDDATRPIAVAVLDKYNEQRRIRLWTEDEYRAYLTDPVKPYQTAGGTEYKLRASRPNDLGFLPFSFVHFSLPVTDFWSCGLGGYLADANAWLVHALTRTGESIEFNLRPILLTKNLRPGAGPPRPLKPGAVWHLDGGRMDESDAEPSADYLMADSSFVAASWDDINNYLDHVADSTGTPKAALRMDVDALRSGASIAQEQAPLADWAKARQRPFTYYEDALAALVLRVGEKHLGAQEFGGYRATAAQLEAACEDASPLAVRWPVMKPVLSGVEKDQHGQWMLDNRLTSRVELAKDEHGFTDGEAREYLEKVADDLMWEHDLFGDLEQAGAEQDAAKAGVMAEAEAAAEPGTKEDDGAEPEPSD